MMALKSIQQAADTWGVSVHTARRLAATGAVHTVTVGRRRLVPESEITRIATTGVKTPTKPRTPSRGQKPVAVEMPLCRIE
jgi:predicted site-specific integrase-resolvase